MWAARLPTLLVRLADDGPVPPVRFGMVAPDEESVRGQPAVGEADHVAALEHLSDGVEVNVKAFPAQNALRSLLADDKKLRRLRDEALRRPGFEANLRLGEAVAAAQESRAAEAGRELLRELTPVRIGPTAWQPSIWNRLVKAGPRPLHGVGGGDLGVTTDAGSVAGRGRRAHLRCPARPGPRGGRSAFWWSTA